MFDISIPWSVIFWLAPFVMPWLSIPAALLAGIGWYRRKKNAYAALRAAFVAAFVAPWTLLLVAAAFDWVSRWSAHVSALAIIGLWLLGALAIVGLILWAASYADSRRR